MKEMVGGCCVCSDERGWPDNPLVYCDGNGCTVAVHQACYGIVTVPTGPWFCRKCESPETKGKVRCELCPSKSGALKRTDTGGWAHVVCALYIPEVRFGNVTSMEPIVLRLIPPERYNKTCYICQDLGKSHRANAGACMQCNKSGCKQQFHVTCAQSLGLLCEEAGNYLDNVKYCGYCQHHYSKLKKGGNVKTIPPYKPVSHDSQSSDSSEKEGEASPMASGSGTPTHPAKVKGPGRKSSHSSSVISGKNTPNASKTPTSSSGQQLDKKKSSPSRRGSSAGDAGGSNSKGDTPAPSPQHTVPELSQPAPIKTLSSSSAPAYNVPINTAKIPLPSSSPTTSKPLEPLGVISTATPATATVSSFVGTNSSTTAATTTIIPLQTPKASTYQETVITNTESVDIKQTKKRKAVSAANTPNTPVDYAATPPHMPGDKNPHTSGSGWEGAHPSSDNQMEPMEKAIKKPKTEESTVVSHFSSLSPAPPPPPPLPAHSPAALPSPRHLPSPMPGPSGINIASNLRSPSHLQGGKVERDVPTSLLVSVPLPSTSHGLNLSAHLQVPLPTDMPGPSTHMYHQPQRQTSMDSGVPGHSPHAVSGRSPWGGLNVSYEMQQDLNKPGASGIPSTSKDTGGMVAMPQGIRNKKRAAVASSVVGMGLAPPPSAMQSTSSQSLANLRRPPQPTPPPLYQDIKDSPPSSPGSERPLKPKLEHNVYSHSRLGVNCAAPHMLGNELNPDSGAAARLQEQLSAELAAHAASSAGMEPLVPPPLMNRAAPSCSITSGRMGSSSAQSLDQLLERQWEQGSQFLMEQAQHFDTDRRPLLGIGFQRETPSMQHHGAGIQQYAAAHLTGSSPEIAGDLLPHFFASLLSCLHQLRTENVRLEEHVSNLLQRRDHLLAVNARLAIPLTAAGPSEPSRCPRENGSQVRATPGPVRTNETITSERSHQLIMREVQQKPS